MDGWIVLLLLPIVLIKDGENTLKKGQLFPHHFYVTQSLFWQWSVPCVGGVWWFVLDGTRSGEGKILILSMPSLACSHKCWPSLSAFGRRSWSPVIHDWSLDTTRRREFFQRYWTADRVSCRCLSLLRRGWWNCGQKFLVERSEDFISFCSGFGFIWLRHSGVRCLVVSFGFFIANWNDHYFECSV